MSNSSPCSRPRFLWSVWTGDQKRARVDNLFVSFEVRQRCSYLTCGTKRPLFVVGWRVECYRDVCVGADLIKFGIGTHAVTVVRGANRWLGLLDVGLDEQLLRTRHTGLRTGEANLHNKVSEVDRNKLESCATNRTSD